MIGTLSVDEGSSRQVTALVTCFDHKILEVAEISATDEQPFSPESVGDV